MTVKRKQRVRRNVRSNNLSNETMLTKNTAPTAISRTITSKVRPFIVRNTEVFTTATHSFASLEAYSVLPISTFAFGWGYSLALNFSKFRFTKFHVKYVPNCPSTTAGAIVMGCGYDMADVFATNTGGYAATFQTAGLGTVNKIQLWKPSVISAVWQASEVAFPAERFTENRVPGSGDWSNGITTTDQALNRNWFSDGYIVIGTDGPSAVSLGRIVVDYEIELFNPFSASEH